MVGTSKIHSFIVTPQDTARFADGEVHSVCSTFTLAREAEWAGRLFVLEMRQPDEEGIGTSLTINHVSPALVGQTVVIEAQGDRYEIGELICSYVARVGERVVAKGQTGQRLLKREKIAEVFMRAAQ
jgi:fluoroacetyl-CoA thioesterase